MDIKFGSGMAGMIEVVLQSSSFWLSCIFIPVVSITLDVILMSFRETDYLKFGKFLFRNHFVRQHSTRTHEIELSYFEL